MLYINVVPDNTRTSAIICMLYTVVVYNNDKVK